MKSDFEILEFKDGIELRLPVQNSDILKKHIEHEKIDKLLEYFKNIKYYIWKNKSSIFDSDNFDDILKYIQDNIDDVSDYYIKINLITHEHQPISIDDMA